MISYICVINSTVYLALLTTLEICTQHADAILAHQAHLLSSLFWKVFVCVGVCLCAYMCLCVFDIVCFLSLNCEHLRGQQDVQSSITC